MKLQIVLLSFWLKILILNKLVTFIKRIKFIFLKKKNLNDFCFLAINLTSNDNKQSLNLTWKQRQRNQSNKTGLTCFDFYFQMII